MPRLRLLRKIDAVMPTFVRVCPVGTQSFSCGGCPEDAEVGSKPFDEAGQPGGTTLLRVVHVFGQAAVRRLRCVLFAAVTAAAMNVSRAGRVQGLWLCKGRGM